MPDFFEQVDEDGIVENHIQSVLKLEEAGARRILSRYREVRRELRDRLDRVPDGSFTEQQLRGYLAQIDGAIAAMTQSLSGVTDQVAEEAALRGVEDLLKELNHFSLKFLDAVVPINLNAAIIADDVSQLLVSRKDASLEAYGAGLRSQISQGLTNAILVGDLTNAEVSKKVGQFFLGEEWKLTRIVRTELHNVYNVAKLKGMEETKTDFLPDLKKTLFHPMDARTAADSKYAASLNLVVNIDEPFEYRWNGENRSFQSPPDRPNDRSILVPFREAWTRPGT